MSDGNDPGFVDRLEGIAEDGWHMAEHTAQGVGQSAEAYGQAAHGTFDDTVSGAYGLVGAGQSAADWDQAGYDAMVSAQSHSGQADQHYDRASQDWSGVGANVFGDGDAAVRQMEDNPTPEAPTPDPPPSGEDGYDDF
ncbi:MAG TPA: hypothetical protein VG435_15640 [Acidimicrobiales bacterium]|jgi:hypothetical protein|nr:hypothetical protein [Acidimicrobiales bacterium]